MECTGLKSVVIPETVIRMGEGVFFHCDLDLNCWVEKGSYAEDWCRQNGYVESMKYMDGSVPAYGHDDDDFGDDETGDEDFGMDE